MTAPAVYAELEPRLAQLARLLHDDHQLVSAAAAVRLGGPSADQSQPYRLELVRDGMRVRVEHGRALLFRGGLGAFYELAGRGRRGRGRRAA